MIRSPAIPGRSVLQAYVFLIEIPPVGERCDYITLPVHYFVSRLSRWTQTRPTRPYSGTAHNRARRRLVSRLELLHTNHLRPSSAGTLRALSRAAESGKTRLWTTQLPNGRRTEGVIGGA